MKKYYLDISDKGNRVYINTNFTPKGTVIEVSEEELVEIQKTSQHTWELDKKQNIVSNVNDNKQVIFKQPRTIKKDIILFLSGMFVGSLVFILYGLIF